MSKINKKYNTNFQTKLFGLTLDRRASTSLQKQLTLHLRDLILSNTATSEQQMPSSRRLAEELSISRVTVMAAFDQLIAEGYLETRTGAGTFIASDLPHIATPAPASSAPPDAPVPQPYSVFHPGIPDLHNFPYRQWARHFDRAWKIPHPALLCKPDPAGWLPLRAEIARHLFAWRDIQCSAAQVIITSGAAETFELIARTLLPAGRAVYVEDPGYAPMQIALRNADLNVIHCPVDESGFDINTALSMGAAQAAIVTPSRHYPLGMTMPLARRLALLDWAKSHDALIVEDDYDGEFRYQGQPLPALSALDDQGRVLYVGSFSKLLSPHLRLGYLVVPSGLTSALTDTLHRLNSKASMTAQPALANFMQSGEFSVHLRRMRRIYATRQRHLFDQISKRLSGYLECAEDPAGMHLVCKLGPKLAQRVTDTEIANACAKQGLAVRAVSAYAHHPTDLQGVILGYAGFDEAHLTEGVERLGTLLRKISP